MKSFELKQEHIQLLSNAYIEWDDCEFGAPCIDPKRPYGNSWVYGDIAEILNIQYDEDADEPFTEEQESYFLELHEELKTALQIILCTNSFIPGVYVCDDYKNNWRNA